MNDANSDQPEDANKSTRPVTPEEQAQADLSRQVADCQEKLKQTEATLAEVRRIIAENNRLEVERSKLLKRERELNELKSNFVTLASHEFRTPMMTILSSASLIGRYNGETDGNNRERHVQRIKSAVNNLTNMLDVFLFMGQMEQGAVDPHPQLIDITHFCQEIITDMQSLAKVGQHFGYEHLTGTTAISIDNTMLRHILINLLTNASKYSAEEANIELTSALIDQSLTLTVQDWGIGIPDADKDKLFTNFFRARNAIHITGTGLGLYLVKQYVDRLGGTIRFISTLDQGTSFTVQLPIREQPV